jgi:hypothetical protein
MPDMRLDFSFASCFLERVELFHVAIRAAVRIRVKCTQMVESTLELAIRIGHMLF